MTLQGTVPSEAARSRAIAVAKANDGVKSVVDQLRIAPAKRSGAAKAGDKVEARRGEGRGQDGQRGEQDRPRNRRRLDQVEDLRAVPADWNTVLDDSDIDVDVKDNVVTLNGRVKSAEAKTKAVAVAKATDGVKSVNDMLKVGAH